MSKSLKEKTISGMVWSTIQKFGTMIISFVSNIILARLLTPDDYGLIGMLMIFIAIANTFIDGGFGSALIQKKEPTKEDYSTIFYWNLLISIFLYAILYLTAPFIAHFYNTSLLGSVLKVQGVVLIINSLGIIQNNQFRKQLRFKELANISIISAIISVSIAIVLAYRGWGVWSLVAQQIIMSLITAVLLWTKNTWRPLLLFSTKSFKELFGFGSFILLSNLIDTFVNNIQGLLIGRFFSSYTMGLYTQARKLEEVASTSISSVVSQVSYPVLAEIQNNRETLMNTLKKLLTTLSFISFPLMILLIVIAEPLIKLLYSDKWLECVPYFKILCVAGIAISLQSINYYAVASIGKSKELFKWTIIKRIFGLFFIILGFIFFQIKGLLWGMVLSSYTIYFINALLVSRFVGYKFCYQLKDLAPIVIISIISGVLAHSISYLSIYWIHSLLLMILLYILVYLTFSYVLKLDAFTTIKQMAIQLINNYRR